ncbi:MAG: protein kinase [Planctomycetaceae bacterium]|nr:protein kinase [Planctomycetaceae bacterium]
MHDAPVNETCRREFEAALFDGEQPDLQMYLPATDHPEYLGTLVELVLIEIEFRWDKAFATQDSLTGPLLPEYVARFPALRDADVEVLATEEELIRGRGQERRVQAERTPDAPPARIRLGDYRIVREIGRGGMGVVYEAEQVTLGRHVALKVLPTSALGNPELVSRFQREARAAAQLHHTNIVPVFGIGESEGEYFYAMQFIEGAGLDDLLKELQQLRASTPSGSAGTNKVASSHQFTPTDRDAPRAARTLLQGELAQTFVP